MHVLTASPRHHLSTTFATNLSTTFVHLQIAFYLVKAEDVLVIPTIPPPLLPIPLSHSRL